MERLQKVLAAAGVASRRKCEEIIAAGRVSVNGKVVTELGAKVDPTSDEIVADGKRIALQQKIYLAFHKPKGVISSAKDPGGRQTVMDYMHGIKERVYPVGRLDYDTEGLILMTNDGEFANLLMHPRFHVPKTYLVHTKGVPHGDALDKLRRGIRLDDGMTAPAEVEYADADPDSKEAIVQITITEGRNRQVRRMFEAIRTPIVRLRRIRFGSVFLGGLQRGKYRHLTKAEIAELRELAEKAGLKETHNVQKGD
ncbi:pseudouridine synthase [Paenibacillus sp.]|uniref:pseudouridine synthase n=1 Tax=Paenibacillus sp. TaxID=58172 RepID=UPI002D349225|nr:pseudouridine synthase [Paenibacillus sp.]HZG55439.1 pseudouridine synthase [Paenibacillus sp.]